MQRYVIREYQKGYAHDQAVIGRSVARNWIWPYAYDVEDLLEIHARPDFDPHTRHYCFLGEEMVGYMFSIVTPSEQGGGSIANLDFPRMMPGHEPAAELLMERALETLKKKGVSLITGRVTTKWTLEGIWMNAPISQPNGTNARLSGAGLFWQSGTKRVSSPIYVCVNREG